MVAAISSVFGDRENLVGLEVNALFAAPFGSEPRRSGVGMARPNLLLPQLDNQA
jgi:hypothetical protein